jgi:hypothetical protein
LHFVSNFEAEDPKTWQGIESLSFLAMW